MEPKTEFMVMVVAIAALLICGIYLAIVGTLNAFWVIVILALIALCGWDAYRIYEDLNGGR